MGLTSLFCLVQGILGFAMYPTADRVRISRLCINGADQRMPMRHRMEPLSLNDMASTTAQLTAHSSGGRLWVATGAQRGATSSLDTGIKRSPQASDLRGHGGPNKTVGLTSLFCLVRGILGFAMYPTADRVRISRLCINDADQRMPMRHRMEPLSLNDMASTTAQLTAHSSGGRLRVATGAQRGATSSLDTAIKGSPQASDLRGHGGPNKTMGLTSLFCLVQ
ncbi:hypothetical protein MTO96_043274, partial [Rhipicephalus appendiculatus]